MTMTTKPKKTNRTRPDQPTTPAPRTLTYEEQASRLLSEGRASLDSEIEMQRQANQRLQTLWDGLQCQREPDPALEVKVAAALTTGTGRVARLLRDQRALTGEAADSLTAAVARALEE